MRARVNPTCERRGRPIKQDGNFLRAHFVGRTAYWDWRYFQALMLESQSARTEQCKSNTAASIAAK
jgi:hypothetical protein